MVPLHGWLQNKITTRLLAFLFYVICFKTPYAQPIAFASHFAAGYTTPGTLPGSTDLPENTPWTFEKMTDHGILNMTDDAIPETTRTEAPACTPTIAIAVSNNDICAGSTLTFTATVTNAGSNPTYQWKKNGQATGTNSATYTGRFNAGDVIQCVLTSNADCATTPVTSNSITMQGSNDVEPEVTIQATETSICNGTSVTFTATNKSGNRNPSYQWFVNGYEVGTNSSTYSTHALTNGAIVLCRMTVPQCHGGTTKDFSDPITITVGATFDPAITISAFATTICKGSPVTFTAAATQAGANPVYQWKLNDQNTGSNSNTFTTEQLSDGDVVSCVLRIDPGFSCATTTQAVSNSLVVKVHEPVTTTVSITSSADAACEGMPVTFTATTENAGPQPVYQWEVNGEKAGGNSPVFTSSSLATGDQVVCKVPPPKMVVFRRVLLPIGLPLP